MGHFSKGIFVVLRLGELACAGIVLGLVSRLFWRLGQAGVHADSRLIYTEVVACIGIPFSIVFMLPFYVCLLSFPIDVIMFVLWLVAFCLQMTVCQTPDPVNSN
jgi:hypothetical protein